MSTLTRRFMLIAKWFFSFLFFGGGTFLGQYWAQQDREKMSVKRRRRSPFSYIRKSSFRCTLSPLRYMYVVVPWVGSSLGGLPQRFPLLYMHSHSMCFGKKNKLKRLRRRGFLRRNDFASLSLNFCEMRWARKDGWVREGFFSAFYIISFLPYNETKTSKHWKREKWSIGGRENIFLCPSILLVPCAAIWLIDIFWAEVIIACCVCLMGNVALATHTHRDRWMKEMLFPPQITPCLTEIDDGVTVKHPPTFLGQYF